MTERRSLAVLETMWGWGGRRHAEAPPFFPINERNASGRQLYRLTGEAPGCQWVTNACRECVSHSSQHGTPDPGWLAGNLARFLALHNKYGPSRWDW